MGLAVHDEHLLGRYEISGGKGDIKYLMRPGGRCGRQSSSRQHWSDSLSWWHDFDADNSEAPVMPR